MNVGKIIAEIEWLEHLFRLPDNRTLLIVICEVKKQKDGETPINDPWRLPRQEWLEHLFKLQDDRPLRT